jgi:hypothetical protein
MLLTDTAGNLVYDENGDRIAADLNNRVYNSGDEVQACHENINHDQHAASDVSGMDTDGYNSGLTAISSCPSEDRDLEYFPHASGDCTAPRDGTPSTTWNEPQPEVA